MRFDYFIKTVDQMKCINKVCSKFGCILVFQRFEQDCVSAELSRVSTELDELASIYLDGMYRMIWLSASDEPRNPNDWEFLSREQENLLVIEGGRQLQDVVEMSRMRTFARDSKMKVVYKSLKAGLEKICTHRGMETYDGTQYPNMRCDPELETCCLREKLGSDTTGTRYLLSHRH